MPEVTQQVAEPCLIQMAQLLNLGLRTPCGPQSRQAHRGSPCLVCGQPLSAPSREPLSPLLLNRL